MGNPFSVKRSRTPILVTLLAVILLGAAYIFIYLPDNEKEIRRQAFRTLQNLDKNVHEKIENSTALLNNLLSAYTGNGNNQKLTDYIAAYPTVNFVLSQPVRRPVNTGNILNTAGTSTTNFSVDYVARQFNLSVGNPADGQLNVISMKYRFDQFIKPLLPENVFDEYVIFSKGKVVFETFPSGLSYNEDSLLTAKSGIYASTVRDLPIGGVDYKLFLQPVALNAGNDWVVAGLLTAGRYNQQKSQLPPRIVLLLITIILIISIAFPWIKLYQMGSRDRLTITDGAMTFFVSMLLMSLLFFSFFRYNVPFRPDKTADSKNVLATAIIKSFSNEVKAAYDQLAKFDTMISVNDALKTDITSLGKNTIGFDNKLAGTETASLLNETVRNTGFSRAFWLNRVGKEVYNWNSAAINAPRSDFSERDYFVRIIDKSGYSFKNTPDKKFYLDQVISWLNGSFKSVISRESLLSNSSWGKVVAALSVDIRSLEKAVMPAGYSFIVMGNDGKVLYHTDTARNLNENLLKEFSDADELYSTMQSHSKNTFLTTYYGREYAVLMQPIAGFPYFLVILSDIEFKETRDTQVFSFTISMLFVFFAFLVAEVAVVMLVSSKRSNFKKQRFATGWLGPKISSHQQYSVASLANCIIIVLLALFFKQSTFAGYLFILLFSTTFTTIFLNCVFAKRYYTEQNTSYFKHKLTTVYWLSAFVLLINAAAFWILERPFGAFFIFELTSLFLCGLVYYRGTGMLVKTERFIRHYINPSWDYVKSYALMALTRLIITSGIPVAFFYSASYNYEQNLGIRYRQLDFANSLKAKYGAGTDLKAAVNGITNNNTAVYADSSWINAIDPVPLDTPVIKPYSKEDRLTISVFNLFRFYKNDLAVKEDRLHSPLAADSLFFYNHLLNDAIYNKKGNIFYAKTEIPGNYLMLGSGALNYRFPSLYEWRGWLFWLVFAVAAGLFYVMMLNIIKKMFALGLPDLAPWKAFDRELLTDPVLNRLLFIIGLPGSGKLSELMKKIDRQEIRHCEDGPLVLGKNLFIADLINIPDSNLAATENVQWNSLKEQALNPQYKLVIVNHFEYNIKDAATNRIKLNFLECLMLNNKGCSIIILSTVHPVTFLDSLNEEAGGQHTIPPHDLERWHVLLGHFRILIHAIEDDKLLVSSTESRQLMIRETQYTHFLRKMRYAGMRALNTFPAGDQVAGADLFPLKLQIASQYFYMYIWQSLTKEEKFLLYDLAEDGLVNTFDDHNLGMLISKGVIIRADGTLKLFNKGFRNFILTSIGNAEFHKIKKDINDNGNWGKLKIPLLVIFIAILAFLLASQQETYSKVIAYISALAAGIPTLAKLFSMVEKSPPKTGSG